MIAAILLFPLLGFLINGLLGRRFSPTVVSSVACGSVFLSFALALVIFVQFLPLPTTERILHVSLFSWIPQLGVDFSLRLDALSLIMTLVITGVGFLIHVYSVGYMKGDAGFSRYFAYLNLFTSSMLLLVLGSNLLLLFIGWEGVGLCSYLLIGFWFEDEAKATAGKKAFIVNRVGDLAFLLALFLTFVTFGTLQMESLQMYDLSQAKTGALTLITILLFIGACGKSAQIPLYVWLPDAMAGPTPVSALIHAATMVTAGVYMVARLHFLYLAAPTSMAVVAIIGITTALFSASIAFFQNDIKKILAYSTISQLGYMFVAVGVGAFASGIFHLVTHAFFKALLFLGAGSVIKALHHEQDIQKMGGLRSKLPLTHLAFLFGTLAIIGVPPFSGFFSKDEILWNAFNYHPLLWFFGWLGAMMTAFYMVRLYTLVFHGESSAALKKNLGKVHEPSIFMTSALVVLAVLSLVGGFLGFPHGLHNLIPIGNFFDHFLAPVFTQQLETHSSLHTEHWLMALTIVSTLVVAYATFRTFTKRKEWAEHVKVKYGKIHQVLVDKYYVDEAYDWAFVTPIKRGAQLCLKWIDTYVIEGIVNGIAHLSMLFSGQSVRLQDGNLQTYAFALVTGVILIFLYYWTVV